MFRISFLRLTQILTKSSFVTIARYLLPLTQINSKGQYHKYSPSLFFCAESTLVTRRGYKKGIRHRMPKAIGQNSLLEKLVLEYQQIHNCDRDVCIGKVENCTEEVVL